jgi:hypothetical protein
MVEDADQCLLAVSFFDDLIGGQKRLDDPLGHGVGAPVRIISYLRKLYIAL